MRTLPGKQISVRRYEHEEAEAVIVQAEAWQARFRRERGETFFHLGDEFYLMTGRPVPPTEVYDGFPQIEDGIGITRHLLDDLDAYLRRAQPGGLTGATGTVACGTLIGPTMRAAIDRFNARTGADLTVVPVENRFLGPEINVSGLLTGHDLLVEFGGRADALPNGPLIVSARMLSDRTGTMLDDRTVEEVGSAIGRPVVPAYTLSDVGRELRARQRRKRAA
jgi:NifB/MoaA-like Fe-S oxidoreductase